MNADKQICGRKPDSQYVELAVEIFGMLQVADAPLSAVEQILHAAGHNAEHALPNLDDFVLRPVSSAARQH